MELFFRVYWAFFKVGAMTFGGGYAMMPILEREVIEKEDWVSLEDAMDFYAIAQCTPGIIGVNTSAHVGYRVDRGRGAAAAALGFITPSILIIMAIAGFLTDLIQIEMVVHAFNGVKICVAVIILNAVVKMLKTGVVDRPTAVMFVAVLGLMIAFNLSTILVIVAAVAVGIILGAVRSASKKGGEEE